MTKQESETKQSKSGRKERHFKPKQDGLSEKEGGKEEGTGSVNDTAEQESVLQSPQQEDTQVEQPGNAPVVQPIEQEAEMPNEQEPQEVVEMEIDNDAQRNDFDDVFIEDENHCKENENIILRKKPWREFNETKRQEKKGKSKESKPKVRLSPKKLLGQQQGK